MKISRKKERNASDSGENSSLLSPHIQERAFPTTLQTIIQSDVQSSGTLSLGTKVYFQERLRNRIYDLIIRQLENYKTAGGTQIKLATRLDRRTDQISRWLSSPGNLTLDTISDLLLGLSGAELRMEIDYPMQEHAKNSRAPEWMVDSPNQKIHSAHSIGAQSHPFQSVYHLINSTINADIISNAVIPAGFYFGIAIGSSSPVRGSGTMLPRQARKQPPSGRRLLKHPERGGAQSLRMPEPITSTLASGPAASVTFTVAERMS